MNSLSLRSQATAFLRRQGLASFLRSGLQHLNARWWLRGATRVGSTRLEGRARVRNEGRLVFGDRIRLAGQPVRLEFGVGPHASLEIGDRTFINYGADISAMRSVRIGQNCAIGQYAIIIDSNFHQTTDHHRLDEPRPVVIEDDVWIGARVAVLPGSHIGRGAVIAAHAVVTGPIPARSLAAGVPARVIRSLDS